MGSQEAEEMGRTVFSLQFVSGLRKVMKMKLVRMEGDNEQLLICAQFE